MTRTELRAHQWLKVFLSRDLQAVRTCLEARRLQTESAAITLMPWAREKKAQSMSAVHWLEAVRSMKSINSSWTAAVDNVEDMFSSECQYHYRDLENDRYV